MCSRGVEQWAQVKQWGWNMDFLVGLLLLLVGVEERSEEVSEEAVRIRPDMGWRQEVQVAVGVCRAALRGLELSQGRREVGFGGGTVGRDWACVGSGRRGGGGGCVISDELLIWGVEVGGEMEMLGWSVSLEMLIDGTVGASSTKIVGMGGMGSSGRLIVGTTGAEKVILGTLAGGRRGSSRPPIVGNSHVGLQLGSKLTIGRPDRSLTADGRGSLGLLSFLDLLVAARRSSLRISIPSPESRISGVASREEGGVGALTVYAALRDRLGGLRWISNRSSRFFSSIGMVSAFCGSGRDPRGREFLDRDCRGTVSGTIGALTSSRSSGSGSS